MLGGEHGNEARSAPFPQIYDRYFPFVWRSVRRLGVDAGAVDDVVQDVFLVVHRRLGEFEGRSSLKTWLYGIVLHVVREHRRTIRRKRTRPDDEPGALDEMVHPAAGADEKMERAQAARLLYALLNELDDERREVFVLAELEEMSAPDIAEVTGLRLHTVYGRLRIARREFEAAVRRHHAREARANRSVS